MRLSDYFKRRQMAGPIYLFLFGTVLFLAMVWWYRNDGVVGMDQTVIEWMALFRRDWLTWVVRILTWFGSVTVIISVDLVITGIGIWKKYGGSDLLIWNFSNITGVALMEILKMFFGRKRPPLPWFATAGGFSFPSGHSMMSTLFYGFLLFLLVRNERFCKGRKGFMMALGSLPVLIGFSRVYLGVHYASDVLAGWAAGLAWLGLGMIVRERGVKKSEAGNRESV